MRLGMRQVCRPALRPSFLPDAATCAATSRGRNSRPSKQSLLSAPPMVVAPHAPACTATGSPFHLGSVVPSDRPRGTSPLGASARVPLNWINPSWGVTRSLIALTSAPPRRDIRFGLTHGKASARRSEPTLADVERQPLSEAVSATFRSRCRLSCAWLPARPSFAFPKRRLASWAFK